MRWVNELQYASLEQDALLSTKLGCVAIEPSWR
jgi:hypothetical protein